VAALRCDGIDAPCVFDGPVNGASFKAYVEQVLPRRCAPATSSSWITSARTKAARSVAIRAAGARLLFLPPYSPDLNPIEQVFAKLKTLIRKAEERTVDGLWRRIGGSLEAFTPGKCANYLRNAGYAST
jgi:transposase